MAGGRPCNATLKNGDPCRSVATVGDHCAGHARRLADGPPSVGESRGDAATLDEPVDSVEPDLPETTGRRKRGRVANVRQALREDAAEQYEKIVGLLEQAMDAGREQYVSCPNCSKRHPVKVADWGARTKAVELLLNQGYGRLADSTKVAGPTSLSETGLDLNSMSLAELKAFLLASYVEHPDELARRRQQVETLGAAIAEGDSIEDAALIAAVESGQKLHRIAGALGVVDPPEDPHDDPPPAPISQSDRSDYPAMVRASHRRAVLRYRDLLGAAKR